MLPYELLQEIFLHLRTPDLLTICQTSKWLNVVATPRVYSDLVFEDQNKAVSAFRTILKSDLAAASVKKVEFSIPEPKSLLFSFYRLAALAIQKTENLRSLLIYAHTPLLKLLRDVPLPFLAHCRLPFSTDAAHFLHHHDTISFLEIHLVGEDIEKFTEAPVTPPLNLPHLSEFGTPAALLPYIARNSPLEKVVLIWRFVENPTRFSKWGEDDAVWPARWLRNHSCFWDERIVEVLANVFPDLEVFEMKNWGFQSWRDNAETILLLRHLGHKLGGFKALRQANFVGEDEKPFVSVRQHFANLDEEHRIATRWGDSCPHLRLVTLPLSGTKWSRVRPAGRSCFIPEGGPDDRFSMNTLWFAKACAQGRYQGFQYSESGREMLDIIGGELEEILRDESRQDSENEVESGGSQTSVDDWESAESDAGEVV